MRVKHSDWALKADEANSAGYASCLRSGSSTLFPEDFVELKRELEELQADVQRCMIKIVRDKRELNALKKYLDVKYIPERSEPIEGRVVKNESS